MSLVRRVSLRQNFGPVSSACDDLRCTLLIVNGRRQLLEVWSYLPCQGAKEGDAEISYVYAVRLSSAPTIVSKVDSQSLLAPVLYEDLAMWIEEGERMLRCESCRGYLHLGALA